MMEQVSLSKNKEPYKASKELADIKKNCSRGLPPLKDHHYDILNDLELRHTRAIRSNRTWFYVNEILRYVKEQKVFRCGHMGETRGGKSEGATMGALIHQTFHNAYLEKGHFDNVDVDLPKIPINITVDNIHRNQTSYLHSIREKFQKGTLIYGEINQVDEREDSTGGLGTMTSDTELKNFNNIVAKYNLGEHWIYPMGFIDMNTTYGIHWFLKDIKKRVNWGLLYKLQASSDGISNQTFLGWVCFPLHQNHELREAYEEKKNAWIDQVIAGGGDPRAVLRFKASEKLAEHPMIRKMKSPKSFFLTNDQMLDIIDKMIIDNELPAFNAEERKRIVGQAQLIVKQKQYPHFFTE